MFENVLLRLLTQLLISCRLFGNVQNQGGGAGGTHTGNGGTRDPFDNPMLIRQYLFSMLGLPGGAENGRMGDYVFSQEG